VTVVGGKVVFEKGKLNTTVRGEALTFDADQE
jgi:dihydroorotase